MDIRGFTLTELLVTITIIGILAAIVIPNLASQLERGRSTEAVNMLSAIAQAERNYKLKNGVYLGIRNSDGDGACEDAENSYGWQNLGFGDPNANPNTRFLYCVDWTDTPNQDIFRVVARRVGTGPAFQGMALNQDGIWDGDYPFVPQNPNDLQCCDTAGPCWIGPPCP